MLPVVSRTRAVFSKCLTICYSNFLYKKLDIFLLPAIVFAMKINTSKDSRSFQVTRVTLRMILPHEEEQWKEVMQKNHPLGDARFSGHQIKYVAEHCGQAVALLCFSACAFHLADRDRWIGWSDEQAACRRHFVIQNSRFLILRKDRPHNLASRVLSLCTKQVPGDWHQRFGFSPLMMETFVDPVHFRGTCYQAAAWIKVGRTRGFRRDGREFYTRDSSPKDIWLKPLRQDAEKLLRAEVLPDNLREFENPLAPKQVAKRIGFEGLRSLFCALHQVNDPRQRKGKRYLLGSCLAIVTCAVLAGCKGVRECAEFGHSLPQKQLEALRTWKNPKTGKYESPGYGTLWRVISSIDSLEVEQVVSQWFTDEGRAPELLAIDGKALRATLHNEDGGAFAVSAVSHSGTPLFSISNSLMQKDMRSTPQAN